MVSDLLEQFKDARNAGTPIISIETPDPGATIDRLRTVLDGSKPIYEWDAARGFVGMNPIATEECLLWKVEPTAMTNIAVMLKAIFTHTSRETVVFVHNAHRYLDNALTVQAIWNCRDEFKQDLRTLVLLGPIFRLPPELVHDIVALDEPMPTRDELKEVVNAQYANAKAAPPPPEKVSAILDAIVGLPRYPAESVLAMSFTSKKHGVDLDKCWRRKVSAIEQTPGLSVWRGKESLDDLKGLDQVVRFMRQLAAADAFGAIVFIDEIEKALAGGLSDYSGDSGVAKDQIGVLLSYMEDSQSMGVLYAGLAGCGKTQLAKATGVACGKPVVKFDLGGMKGSKLGESEKMIRTALKMVTATSEGRTLFIATANNAASFTPELNRRLPDQFFFDLLDADARAQAWEVYIRKNDLPAQLTPDDEYTGAEIKRVCERAAMFKIPLVDAAEFVVASAVSAEDLIDQRRRAAHGRMLSAAKPGLYRMPEAKPRKRGGREIATN